MIRRRLLSVLGLAAAVSAGLMGLAGCSPKSSGPAGPAEIVFGNLARREPGLHGAHLAGRRCWTRCRPRS